MVSLAKTKKIASFFILSALLNSKGKRNESKWYGIIGELGRGIRGRIRGHTLISYLIFSNRLLISYSLHIFDFVIVTPDITILEFYSSNHREKQIHRRGRGEKRLVRKN